MDCVFEYIYVKSRKKNNKLFRFVLVCGMLPFQIVSHIRDIVELNSN